MQIFIIFFAAVPKRRRLDSTRLTQGPTLHHPTRKFLRGSRKYLFPVQVEKCITFQNLAPAQSGGGGGGGLLPAMFVAANRWSTDGEIGQETRINVLYLQRGREREGEREGRAREREREREGGWWGVWGGACYLLCLWLQIDGPPMER